MKNNKNHPKTDRDLAMLRERFCEMHTSPVGKIFYTMKSDNAHHVKLLFNKLTEVLNKAYENE